MLENNDLFVRIKEIRGQKKVIERFIHKIKDSELHSKEDKYYLVKLLEYLKVEENEILNKLQGEED